MTTSSEQVQQRSDLIGTQVITRDSGKKLGVVSQLWVDVDQRQVVALGLRENLLSGTPRVMLLTSIVQVGDVILVDDEDALEDVDVLNYSTLIGSEVITETGELLGKVRGFKFDVINGQISDLIIASLGIPLIPAQLLSTYELPVEEIVSSGPERLIVFEGAEERLNQLTVGVLERLGITGPPWEREDEEDYFPTAPASNQLGAGTRPTYPSARRVQPQYEYEEAWEDEGWEDDRQPLPEPRRRSSPPARRVRETPVYEETEYEDEFEYEDEPRYEAETWSPKPVEFEDKPATSQSQYEDLATEDAWADEYEPPEINLPKRVKEPEYDRDPDY